MHHLEGGPLRSGVAKGGASFPGSHFVEIFGEEVGALRFQDEVMVAVTSATLKTFLWQAGRSDELIHWEGVCQIKSPLRGYLTVLLA